MADRIELDLDLDRVLDPPADAAQLPDDYLVPVAMGDLRALARAIRAAQEVADVMRPDLWPLEEEALAALGDALVPFDAKEARGG